MYDKGSSKLERQQSVSKENATKPEQKIQTDRRNANEKKKVKCKCKKMGRQNASDLRIHATMAQAATTTFTAEACHQSEIFLSIRKASAGRSIRSLLVKAFVQLQYSTLQYCTE